MDESAERLQTRGVAGLPWGTVILAGLFTISGVVHVASPGVFESLIPPILGSPTVWVVASGIAELIAAFGLVTRRSWGPAFAAGVLLVVWVGNFWMAYEVITSSDSSGWMKLGVLLRLPLQVPMMIWAWRSPVGRPATGPAR